MNTAAVNNAGLNRYPVVVVEWIDAWTSQEEIKIHELENYSPAVRLQVGFLVYEDEGHLHLAAIDDVRAERDNDVALVTSLPKGMVKSVHRYERLSMYHPPNHSSMQPLSAEDLTKLNAATQPWRRQFEEPG